MKRGGIFFQNPKKRVITIFLCILLVLLLPLIMMQISSEVNWSLSDFVIAGLILFVGGTLLEIILRKLQTVKGRVISVIVLVLLILLVWLELAVGIFGSPFAGW